VYGKSSLFLKEALSTLLEEVRYTFLEVSGVAIRKLQATYRMFKLFRKYRVMKRGVTLLQANTRCNLLRGGYLAQKYAANRIKAYFRMHRKFVWFRRLKKSVNVIKAKLLGEFVV
jgi:myosin heavy subunit